MSTLPPFRGPLAVFTMLGLSLAAGCGSDSTGPDVPGFGEIVGNITTNDFSDLHSVGFILTGEDYQFFAVPGQQVTSINAVDTERGLAFGWSRATADPATANERGFVLNLRDGSFQEVRVPNVDRTVVRGMDPEGRLVGLANIRATGESFGFIYDPETGESIEVRRPGYTQGALTGGNASGTMIGYSDFGLAGFVLRGGEFFPLETPEAGRLFPMQINDSGVIVGLWGEHGTWWDRSRGFIATPDGEGYDVRPYLVTGGHITALSGINDAGKLAGLYNPQGNAAPARVFTAAGPTALSRTFPTPDPNLDPWVSGITNADHVYGSVTILHTPSTPEECGGHGHLHGTQCHCDAGYQQDPDDPGMCIAA